MTQTACWAETGEVSAEDLDMLAEDIKVLVEDIHVLVEDIHISAEDINVLVKDIHVLVKDIHVSVEDIHISTEDIDVLAEDIHVSAEDIAALVEDIHVSAGDLNVLQRRHSRCGDSPPKESAHKFRSKRPLKRLTGYIHGRGPSLRPIARSRICRFSSGHPPRPTGARSVRRGRRLKWSRTMSEMFDIPRITNPPVLAAAGDTPPPSAPTHYELIASQLIGAINTALDQLSSFETPHSTNRDFVRGHLTIPDSFIKKMIATVEQRGELQSLDKFDVAQSRDSMQFVDAMKTVVDRLEAGAVNVRRIADARKAGVAASALQVYYLAKGIARDPGSGDLELVVAQMGRDLGRQRPTPRTRKEEPAPTNPQS